jgi:hypothetical protein
MKPKLCPTCRLPNAIACADEWHLTPIPRIESMTNSELIELRNHVIEETDEQLHEIDRELEIRATKTYINDSTMGRLAK